MGRFVADPDVLVKEGSKIKAVNKKSLKEHSYIKNK